ncbi:hypothetical protein HHI36_024004 [Cryptolaemus montrouzieri]|uniref:Uncharacterized protein n=1 Tax=Cryptolaemus montrouzieri TaxID=559131 RepID=A0ABD2NZ11_9CUCU
MTIRNKPLEFEDDEGNKHTIPMSEDVDDIYVKVHDFPLEMDNDKIRKAMKKDIPSYITIENETSLVTYKGQPRTCRLFDNPYHAMRDCPTKPANRMRLIRQQNDPSIPNTLVQPPFKC